MPRITDSDEGEVDFCNQCFPDEEEAESRFKYKVSAEANDGRGDCFWYSEDWGDNSHPCYDETDYTCEDCGGKLTEVDN